MVASNGKCMETCESIYEVSSDRKSCVLNLNQQANNDLKFVPLPFFVVSMIAVLFIFGFKLHFKMMFIPGAVVGSLGIIEWSSWVTLMFLAIY